MGFNKLDIFRNLELKRRCLFSIIVLITCLLINPIVVHAQTYTIIAKEQNGAPIVGAEVHGINDLPATFTDSNGRFQVDTTMLVDKQPVVALSSIAKGYRFEPAELVLNTTNCPNRECVFTGFLGGDVTSVIHWRLQNSRGQPVPGMQVVIPGAELPCPKTTDSEGRVIFAVRKHNSACNNSNNDSKDDYYRVVHLSAYNQNCTFTTNLSKKFDVCTNGTDDFFGYSTVSCSLASNVATGNSVTYTVKVVQSNGFGLPGVSFYGTRLGEGNYLSDNSGIFRLSTSSIGASATDSIDLIPIKAGFNFYPPVLTLSPDGRSDKIFTLQAMQSDSSAALITAVVKQGNSGLGGVEVAVPSAFSCEATYKSITNQQGLAYFSTLVASSCNDADSNLYNNNLVFNPYRQGCQFTNPNSFQLCPRSTQNSLEISAYCGVPAPEQYKVSGAVLDTLGLPLSDVPVLDLSGKSMALSDQQGRYSFWAVENSTYTLKALKDNLLFDPNFTQLDAIDREFSKINFNAVAPDDSLGILPPERSPCPIKDFYNISGSVFDLDGKPLAGVSISNNFKEVAISASDGSYAITLPGLKSAWLTPKRGADLFDPAAYSFPNLFCDQAQVNFKQARAISYMLSGIVSDRDNLPIPNVEVVLNINGAQRRTTTDNSGRYFHTALDGETYSLEATGAFQEINLVFSPGAINGQATQHEDDLNFRAEQSIAPTATPTLTATNTFTPSVTPTFTITRTPTKTPTLTITPTNTATYTSTKTPTYTRTFTPVPTLTPTATFTITNTAVSTSTSVPTATSTATNTAYFLVATSTATRNVQATVAPTSTQIDTPTYTPTLELSPTYTPAPTPRPVRWKEIQVANQDGYGLDAALGPNGVSLSSYNSGGDLKFHEPVQAGIDNWDHHTIDAQARVGGMQAETALVFDAAQSPHIFYLNQKEGHLKHAYRLENVWQTETVDANPSVGAYAQAVVCGNDKFCVCYQDLANTDLKFAQGNANNWTITTIDNGAANAVGEYCDIDIDKNGNPVVAYYDATAKAPKAARRVNGQWEVVSLGENGSNFGMWPSIAVLPDNSIEIYSSYVVPSYGPDVSLTKQIKTPNAAWNEPWGIENVYGFNIGGYPEVYIDKLGHKQLTYRHVMASALFGTQTGVVFSGQQISGAILGQYFNRGSCTQYSYWLNTGMANDEFPFVAYYMNYSCYGSYYNGIILQIPEYDLPTATPTVTATATNTATFTASATPTKTATETVTRTPTITSTATVTQTFTKTPTITVTQTPTASATFTKTATITATPTFTASATVTKTATATATPDLRLRLTSMCYDSDTQVTRWRVTNPRDMTVNFTWDNYLSRPNQSGSGSIGANGQVYFDVKGDHPVTVRIFEGDRQQDVKASNGTACIQPTATPLPTSTNTPEPTSTFTPGPTPTPTSVPTFSISGALYSDKNGVPLSESEMLRMQDSIIAIEVKRLDTKAREVTTSQLQAPYEYSIDGLEAGKYQISLVSAGRIVLSVKSVPKVYRINFTADTQGVNFAVGLKNNRLVGDKAKKAKSKAMSK